MGERVQHKYKFYIPTQIICDLNQKLAFWIILMFPTSNFKDTEMKLTFLCLKKEQKNSSS